MWRTLINMWKAHNLLDQAWQQSSKMLEITYEMFVEAIEVLKTGENVSLKRDIHNKDQIVNEYMQDVRRKVLTHCSVQGPQELPAGLVLVSIIIDLERIGDYTKNIVDMAKHRSTKLNAGIFTKDLDKIEQSVKEYFRQTKIYIQTSDAKSALELFNKYEWIGKKCDKCLIDLVHEKDKTITLGDSATLALYFRQLKRVNAHLRNITTSIVNPFDRIGFKPKTIK
jgi:phosphate transport system protein